MSLLQQEQVHVTVIPVIKIMDMSLREQPQEDFARL